MKLLNIVGARPNFMKMAPILRALSSHPDIEWKLVHTGQHYDQRMSQIFFEDLQMPVPDIFLGIGSGSHAEQTGKAMIALEAVMLDYQPDLVIVVGDVNSTLAGALAAAKLHIPVAHIEAGLRSLDRSMPEEINRICVDSISELFFTTSTTARDNLIHEGIAPDKIHFVGNVMIDSLLTFMEKAQESTILEYLGVQPNTYGLLTLHHPENVDDQATLTRLLEVIAAISDKIPLVFPLHPRTQKRLEAFGLQSLLDRSSRILVTAPLGYLDFLQVLSSARFALIDSSGIQEETTVLGIPCLTMRDNTERPETVTAGTNVLVGRHTKHIVEEVDRVLKGQVKVGHIPDLWDGQSAKRIVDTIADWWQAKRQIPHLSSSLME